MVLLQFAKHMKFKNTVEVKLDCFKLSILSLEHHLSSTL